MKNTSIKIQKIDGEKIRRYEAWLCYVLCLFIIGDYEGDTKNIWIY